MSKGLKELKRLAYENACCRCQYYINKKCTNNYECVWKTIEKELKVLEILKEICLEGKDKYGKGTWGWVEFDLDNETKLKEWLKNET